MAGGDGPGESDESGDKSETIPHTINEITNKPKIPNHKIILPPPPSGSNNCSVSPPDPTTSPPDPTPGSPIIYIYYLKTN